MMIFCWTDEIYIYIYIVFVFHLLWVLLSHCLSLSWITYIYIVYSIKGKLRKSWLYIEYIWLNYWKGYLGLSSPRLRIVSFSIMKIIIIITAPKGWRTSMAATSTWVDHFLCRFSFTTYINLFTPSFIIYANTYIDMSMCLGVLWNNDQSYLWEN